MTAEAAIPRIIKLRRVRILIHKKRVADVFFITFS